MPYRIRKRYFKDLQRAESNQRGGTSVPLHTFPEVQQLNAQAEAKAQARIAAAKAKAPAKGKSKDKGKSKKGKGKGGKA